MLFWGGFGISLAERQPGSGVAFPALLPRAPRWRSGRISAADGEVGGGGVRLGRRTPSRRLAQRTQTIWRRAYVFTPPLGQTADPAAPALESAILDPNANVAELLSVTAAQEAQAALETQQ